jgi:hypothetical protein
MCHEAKEGDEDTTDLSEHMLAFANDRLASSFDYMLGLYAELGEEDGENNSAQDCMGPNSAKAVEGGVGDEGGRDKDGPDCTGASGDEAALAALTAVGQAGGGQGGQQVAICPQEAQLGTVWIGAVSVAIFLLHTIDEGRQIMRECAKELDCIAKQNPRLLFFAVVCPEAGGHLNGQLWGGEGHQTMWCSYRWTGS